MLRPNNYAVLRLKKDTFFSDLKHFFDILVILCDFHKKSITEIEILIYISFVRSNPLFLKGCYWTALV